MSHDEIEAVIREYIPQIIHLSLATVKDGRPWVCEVHFAYDDGLNLYFGSSANSRHAQELIANPHVAGNIVTQHHKNQKVRCVDFEGTARMLDAKQAEAVAFPVYTERFGAAKNLLDEIRKDGHMRFFKISVDSFYLFDSYGDERKKHALPWGGGV